MATDPLWKCPVCKSATDPVSWYDNDVLLPCPTCESHVAIVCPVCSLALDPVEQLPEVVND